MQQMGRDCQPLINDGAQDFIRIGPEILESFRDRVALQPMRGERWYLFGPSAAGR
jgi:hypothetical protein